MYEITLELIKTFFELTSSLIILGFGAAFARYTVNRYQKSRDSQLIRESLLKLQYEVSLKMIEFKVALIQLYEDLYQKSMKLTQISKQSLEDELEAEEIIKSLKDLFAFSDIEKESHIKIGELESISNLLTVRMITQLILNKGDLEVIIKLIEIRKKLSQSALVSLVYYERIRHISFDSFSEIIEELKEIREESIEYLEIAKTALDEIAGIPNILLTADIKF